MIIRKQKPCIKIILIEKELSVFDSKVGGYGYIPPSGNVPCDEEGNQFRLLAQIRCEEVDFPPFPHSGLLQFWISNSPENELYGCDLSEPTKQKNFRICYYPELNETIPEQEIIAKYKPIPEEDEEFPVYGEFGMQFLKDRSLYFDWENMEDEDYEKIEDELSELHHQIGGFPYFTQADPRPENSAYQFLLFQLDSEYFPSAAHEIAWGDCGIGNFFIDPEKLRNLDFSDVWYNWDCC